MKKRILSILLTLCMVLCLVPTAVLAADEVREGQRNCRARGGRKHHGRGHFGQHRF